MLKLAPRWNRRSIPLLTVSAIFWLLCVLGTALLGYVAFNQYPRGFHVDFIASVLLVVALAVTCGVWGLGILRIGRVNYCAFLDGEFFVWQERWWGRVREKRIRVQSIEWFDHLGTPALGYRLQVAAGMKVHRLGSLLSMNEVYQLMRLIEQAKEGEAKVRDRAAADR